VLGWEGVQVSKTRKQKGIQQLKLGGRGGAVLQQYRYNWKFDVLKGKRRDRKHRATAIPK
jgi:hypothetical protein